MIVCSNNKRNTSCSSSHYLRLECNKFNIRKWKPNWIIYSQQKSGHSPKCHPWGSAAGRRKWAIPEKIQRGGIEDILFWKAPLEILDLSLYPKKFQRKKAFTLEILQICVTPLGNPKVKNQNSWKFCITIIHGNFGHPGNFSGSVTTIFKML